MRGFPFRLLSEVSGRRQRQAALQLAETQAALQRREQEWLEVERQEVEKLFREADRWRRQNLREYLAAVREAQGPVCEGGDVVPSGGRLAWAEGIAEEIDPVGVAGRAAGRNQSLPSSERPSAPIHPNPSLALYFERKCRRFSDRRLPCCYPVTAIEDKKPRFSAVWRVSEWLAATLEMWCRETGCGFESHALRSIDEYIFAFAFL